ncbi:pkd2 [Symbiodinium pilosum]|uniref:Pkd2 protein n=1 Tax=Symbiodinium pilosum TaxID=2952 RepID=A0A812U7E9_SYMPI|nr:pkd2 [Symbiodinium pilosum]
MSVENSIETDISENANFAFEGYFGNKVIEDVNSFADFWSWTRLGLLPLVFPEMPYFYSEGLADVVPEGYDVNALPQRWLYPGYQKPAPVQNDYLRYNRIIGGLRFRQEVSTDDKATCTHFGAEETFRRWVGKPCTHFTEYELPPDLMATEAFSSAPQRVEWFLPEVEGNSALIQHVIDMEDGCFSARAQNRTCLCQWCDAQVNSHPWLDEQTQRVEVAFITYNAHYGLYNLATANFWFSRGGNIFKLVFVRSSWAGLEVREPGVLALIAISGLLWVLGCLYLAKVELLEMATMIQRSNKIWYYTLAQDYLGFWNCVDWLAIIMTTVISISFGVLHIFIGDVNGKLGAIVTQVDSSGYPPLETYREVVSEFADAVVAMLDAERNLRLWLCIYPVVLLMRLFKSFAAQKRLAIVTDTFRMAYNDLMHFFIVFASVYFCMTVNAVIFFGQDILDFATIDRALHACFRAMLGDWDWDAMGKIGIHKAFAWFFFFMVVMVMILMNMLVAILMEAYGVVKDDAKNADSLLQQTKNLLRRARQNKRKERVNLTTIWDALRKDHNDDEDALLSSERKITPRYLRDIVEGIPASQALRTLKNSQTDYDKKVDPAFELQDFKVGLTSMVTRLDYSALCATYLSEKIRQYQDLAKAEGRDTGGFEKALTTLSLPLGDFEGAPTDVETYENSAEQALEKVKALARDHSTEMADGIAAILGEEMQELEKRQHTQRKAINTTCEQLQRLRDMVHHLSSTCADISNLTTQLGQPTASALRGAEVVPPRVIMDGTS